MWIIFGIRFKKIFSPDGMIEKAREGMNRLLRSMQKNTFENVNLVNESIQKLEQAKIAAERKVEEINRKIELLNAEAGMVQFRDKIQEQVKQPLRQPVTAGIDPNAAYSVKTPVQKDLFSSDVHPLKTNRDEIVVTPSGAAYKEVPMITTKMFEEKPSDGDSPKTASVISPKKSVDEQVMYLFNNGYSVSDIASNLKLSEVEVQFVIDLN